MDNLNETRTLAHPICMCLGSIGLFILTSHR